MEFEYPEDREFFANLLASGDTERLEREFSHLFDFRDPDIKRKEFNAIRSREFKRLSSEHGLRCQLRIVPNCSESGHYQVDHWIPLKSNELHKMLRHLKRVSSKKVPAQSFGSNHPDNLALACKECNREKAYLIVKPKYRILIIEDRWLADEFHISEFTLPAGEGRVELIKWQTIPPRYIERIEELHPDLIAFQGVLAPLSWQELIKNIREDNRLKGTPIFASSYLGALESLGSWNDLGLTDFLAVFRPEDLILHYLAYLRNPLRYVPRRGISMLYWGARRQKLR